MIYIYTYKASFNVKCLLQCRTYAGYQVLRVRPSNITHQQVANISKF
jgi:hypothetical protein